MSEADLVVGYIGSLSSYYNLDSLLDYAFYFKSQNCFNIKFIIVGSGPSSLSIRKRINDLNLSNVHMYDAVSREYVFPIIKLFDICYIGLVDLEVHNYGISCNKLFEYMSI